MLSDLWDIYKEYDVHPEPIRRLIIHKGLVDKSYYFKYARIYKLNELQKDKHYYKPEDLKKLLSYSHPGPSREETKLRNSFDHQTAKDKKSAIME